MIRTELPGFKIVRNKMKVRRQDMSR
jgi:hypothetical protein